MIELMIYRHNDEIVKKLSEIRFEKYEEKGRLKKIWMKIICENMRIYDADETINDNNIMFSDLPGKRRNYGERRMGLYGTVAVCINRHRNQLVQHRFQTSDFSYSLVDNNVTGEQSKTTNPRLEPFLLYRLQIGFCIFNIVFYFDS